MIITLKLFLLENKKALASIALCKFIEGVAILLAAKFLVEFDFLAVFGFLAARLLIDSISATKFLQLAEKFQLAIRQKLHAELFQRQIPADELLTLIFDTAQTLGEFFTKILPQITSTLILLPLFFVCALIVDWLTAAILLATLPISPLLLFLIGKATAEKNARAWQELQRLNRAFKEILSAITTLKMFGRIDNAAAQLAATSAKSSAATLEVLKLAFVSSFALELIITLSIALVAVTLGLRLVAGTVDFEAALFLLLLTPEFFAPLRKLGVMFHVLIAAKMALTRLQFLLAEPPVLSTSIGKLPVPPEIFVENVSYTYPQKISPALENLTLTIPKGKITAIVGESGSGKTTLLKILAGLIAPTQGKIFLGGLPLAQFQPQSLWQKIAYVPQSPHLFAATLAENVSMFNQLSTKNLPALLAALALDLDLDSTKKISRGQLQRLGIIRALLKDSPVLIFDEPTAGLDADSEAKVLAALKKFSSRRTIVIATHRQSVIDFADVIITLSPENLS